MEYDKFTIILVHLKSIYRNREENCVTDRKASGRRTGTLVPI